MAKVCKGQFTFPRVVCDQLEFSSVEFHKCGQCDTFVPVDELRPCATAITPNCQICDNCWNDDFPSCHQCTLFDEMRQEMSQAWEEWCVEYQQEMPQPLEWWQE